VVFFYSFLQFIFEIRFRDSISRFIFEVHSQVCFLFISEWFIIIHFALVSVLAIKCNGLIFILPTLYFMLVYLSLLLIVLYSEIKLFIIVSTLNRLIRRKSKILLKGCPKSFFTIFIFFFPTYKRFFHSSKCHESF
jgi:hypothetical protein